MIDPTLILLTISILLLICLMFVTVAFVKANTKAKKFRFVSDVAKYKHQLEKELSKQIKKGNALIAEKAKEAEKIKSVLKGLETRKEQLNKEISMYEEDIDTINVGFYRPTFEFGTSEKYKTHIIDNQRRQKALVKSGGACICNTPWTVNNSRSEGKKMVNRTIKLAIKTFNNECDTIISKTRWNNYETMLNRIVKAYEFINNMNEPNDTHLTKEFLDLKMEELKLVFHHKEKLYQEQEEQKAINAEIREQKKIEAEIKKAELKAKRDEEDALKQAQVAEKAYQDALKDFEIKTDREKELLKEQLRILDEERKKTVALANEKSGELLKISSMAQHTKMGRVYVLSNIGSFGKNVCKIGMTRALDPMDRVRTLSGASVPFEFDCHAMIATKDAPALEGALHKAFESRRVNLSNLRKEYFKVSLDEIEKWLNENGYEEVEFTKDREARTYRETLAILKQIENA